MSINYIKIVFLFFSVVPLSVYSQKKTDIKFVIEKGKFFFDKKGYQDYKKDIEEIIKSHKEIDSLSKANPQMSFSWIDDRTIEYPQFDTATAIFRDKLFENINLKNAKLGQNKLSIYIDKYGNVKRFRRIKIADRKICKQIKSLIFSDDFKKWKPANFLGIIVDYNFVFSIIIDKDFSKYDLKNKWSRETNKPEPKF